MESVLKTRWKTIFPQCLVYPPCVVAIDPKGCIRVEDVATSLFRGDGLYISKLFEDNYFNNAARRRITTNLQQEVRHYVYTFMYPEEYTLTESIPKSDSHSSTSGENSSTTVKMKMSASESRIRLQRNLKNKSLL